MKYKFKNPVVDGTRVTQTGLPPINGKQPVVGDYIITDPFGERRLITIEELLRTCVPADSNTRDPKTNQLFLLAQSIVDQGTMVDDDNAETLLFEAVESAHKILQLLG